MATLDGSTISSLAAYIAGQITRFRDIMIMSQAVEQSILILLLARFSAPVLHSILMHFVLHFYA